MKATISFGKKSPGAVFQIVHNLRGAFSSRNLTGQAKANKQQGEIYVEASIGKEEFEGILNSIDTYQKLQPNLTYAPEDKDAAVEKIVYPPDYGLLKGQVRQFKEEATREHSKRDDIEELLKEERKVSATEIQRLKSDLARLEAKCQNVANVESFQQEMMMRENSLWEVLLRSYRGTLEQGAGLSGLSLEELEKACLDYVPVRESRNFLDIRRQYEKAKQARAYVESNPFVSLESKAKEILDMGDKILERGEIIELIRSEIVGQLSGKKLRIALTTENGAALLTFPFKIKNQYAWLEQSLLEKIEKHISDIGLSHKKEDYNGLLRIKIEEAKTNKKKRLLRILVSDKQDPFSRFGGKKEIVELEIHGQED